MTGCGPLCEETGLKYFLSRKCPCHLQRNRIPFREVRKLYFLTDKLPERTQNAGEGNSMAFSDFEG